MATCTSGLIMGATTRPSILLLFLTGFTGACINPSRPPDDGGIGETNQDAGSDRCGQVLEEASAIDADLAEEFSGPCVVDEDCAVDFGFVDCVDGGSLDTSEIAYAVERSEEFLVEQKSRYLDICRRGCSFHLDAFFKFAYCEDGKCKGADVHPDSKCPAILEYIEAGTDEFSDDWSLGCEVEGDCLTRIFEVRCSNESVFQTCALPVSSTELTTMMEHEDLFAEIVCDDWPFRCEEMSASCSSNMDVVCLGNRCVVVGSTDGGF